MCRVLPFTLLLAAMMTAAFCAQADRRSEARRYFDAGVSLLKAEDYEGAALSFEAQVEIYPTSSGLFNLANCYKALQRYGEALEVLSRLRRDFAGRMGEEMEAEAETIEREIRNLVGTLHVEVDRPGATVFVSGQEVGVSPLAGPLLLPPGNYEVTARMEGVEFDATQVRMLPGRELSASLRAKGVETRSDDGAPDQSGDSPRFGLEPGIEDEEERPSGLSPGWFWGVLATTALLGGATIGVDAAVGRANQEVPDRAEKDRVERMQAGGISLLALTGAATLTAAVLALFTDWGGTEPEPGGISPSAWARQDGAGLGIEWSF